MFGLILTTFASAALAGERYIEVWNPPEARGDGSLAKRAEVPAPRHKGTRRSPASLRSASVHTRHALSDAAAPVLARPTNASAPTFDKIPRQITPEGNVLRVRGGRAGVVIRR